jgi:hypothetical protein
MPYFNQPFFGANEDPLVETPYFTEWKNDIILPPPGSDLMITEGGDLMITQATNDYMLTE